jgi:hypothetical protein
MRVHGDRGVDMGDTKTYVLFRRQEAADALAAVAPSHGLRRGAKYVIVLPHESYDEAAQRLRDEDAEIRIVFVLEDDEVAPMIAGSSILRTPSGGKFSYIDAQTSDLAALAYAEAFRNAVSATECNT